MFLKNNISAGFPVCVCETEMYFCGTLLQIYKSFHVSGYLFVFSNLFAVTNLHRLFNNTISTTD